MFAAMTFTALSVRSFQVPPTLVTCACPPSIPSIPTSLATLIASSANTLKLSVILSTVSLSSKISPHTSTSIFFVNCPPSHGFRHFSNGPYLIRQDHGHQVDVIGKHQWNRRSARLQIDRAEGNGPSTSPEPLVQSLGHLIFPGFRPRENHGKT